MPSKIQHQSIAFMATLSGHSLLEIHEGNLTVKPVLSAAVAVFAANLPDLIEPATSSHHRQFFHSALFGCLVVSAGVKVYQWQPEEDWEKLLRHVLLAGCGAYLIHVVADACTPRGLPVLGRV
jgi:membrane-bound metal-dependent hydrolase YbcI (DUF457 family)